MTVWYVPLNFLSENFLFFRSMVELANPGASYSGRSFLGFGVPLVIVLGFLLLGVILEIAWHLGGHGNFFGGATPHELLGFSETPVLCVPASPREFG